VLRQLAGQVRAQQRAQPARPQRRNHGRRRRGPVGGAFQHDLANDDTVPPVRGHR
jgi:hypothetical protein